MRITLNQEEIEEAIEKLILDQVDVPDDMRIDIDLKATRGDEGYTAEVDILEFDAPVDGTDRSVDDRIDVADGAKGMSIAEKADQAKREATKPRRRGRPAGARNKPKTHRRDPDIVADDEQDTNQDQDQESELASEQYPEQDSAEEPDQQDPEDSDVDHDPVESNQKPESEVGSDVDEPVEDELSDVTKEEQEIPIQESDPEPESETEVQEEKPASPTRSLFSRPVSE